MINITNIKAVNNQKQALIRKNLSEIYTHEKAHKAAGGSLTGPIVIDWKNGIPVGGHVSIRLPKVNPKNPKKTIDEANTVIDSAMAPSDPSAQDYKVAAQAKAVKLQAEKIQNKKGLDYYA